MTKTVRLTSPATGDSIVELMAEAQRIASILGITLDAVTIEDGEQVEGFGYTGSWLVGERPATADECSGAAQFPAGVEVYDIRQPPNGLEADFSAYMLEARRQADELGRMPFIPPSSGAWGSF